MGCVFKDNIYMCESVSTMVDPINNSPNSLNKYHFSNLIQFKLRKQTPTIYKHHVPELPNGQKSKKRNINVMRDEGVGVSMRDTCHSKEMTRVSVVPGQGGLRVASSGFGLQATVGWAVSSGGLRIDFCWAYSLVGAGGPRMAVLGRASESPTGLHASGLFIPLGR